MHNLLSISLQRLLAGALIGSLLFCGAGNALALSAYATGGDDVSPPLLTAGIFRIESERSYKLSLQLALGIMNAQASKDRERSLATIERMRKDLVKPTEKTKKTIRAFSRVSAALDDQVRALPSLNAQTAGSLYDVNEDLLNKMNFLSFALEAETSDTPSRIVGLALRQASLAQRMAKIVLLRSMDKTQLAKQGLQVDLAQSKIEFANGLVQLNDEVLLSSQLLRDRVALAQQQWIFYEAALKSTSSNVADLRNISTTSDRIAEMMIEVVRLGYALPPESVMLARR